VVAMRLVPILACVAVGLGLASSAGAQLVPVPGTLVAMAPPKGFTLARSFSGFENVRGGSSITVEEMPPSAAADIVAAFSSPKSVTTRFASQGVRITRIDRIALDSGEAPLAVGEQSFKGSEFVKYMTLLGGRDGKNTVLITFNLSAATPLRQSDVEAIVRSVTIGRPPSLSEKLAQVPFTFKAAPPFHTADAMPGSAVILATLDGIDPEGKKPSIVIGKVPTSASPAENEQVNEREMRSVPGFRDAPVTERRTTPFAGGSGNFISAAANGRTVMQFVRVLPGGSLVRMLATGDTAAIEGARESILEIASSVQLPQ
jgi:hypothetical protein